MEFKTTKKEFLKALQWGLGIVERKTTMPILSNILLEGQGKKLKIAATDLETTAVVEANVEILKPGKIAINARNLYEVVKELPKEEISVEGEKSGWLELKSGKAKFKIVGMDPQEFPTLPVSKGPRFKLESKVIHEMIEKTLYAVSTNETRLALNGIYLERVQEGAGSVLRMVATDGHRLSYVDREIKGEVKVDKGLILPRKGIVELKKLLEGGEGDLELGLEEKQIVAHRGDVSLFLRLVEGEFPDYKQVVPKKLERILTTSRESLVGALKRTALVSLDKSRGVSFSFSPGNLELSSSHPDFGEAREELPVEYRGESFRVGFNARYFLDVLSVLQDEKVVLELKDEVSPCVIRSEFDRGFLSLIMPMRL
ncbi:MAG: DNA polymerase III subunit beta [Deltaproteobacteria bacterium]|nr:DNA polymerase III subunit beta [Deltaproteobacteria bacterium]